MLEVDKVEKTTCCLLVDKEEIGSVGATGMQSRFFENTVAELIDRVEGYNDLTYRRCLSNSKMLSSDVSAAYDPNFGEAFEKKNTAFFGKGMVFNKYTGARGKSGSNDANAEYFAEIRRILDDNDVSFQTAELGKVALENGITMSIHAPYYINFANESEEMIEKSYAYVLTGLNYLNLMGGKHLAFHAASQGKLSRERALELTRNRLEILAKKVRIPFS